MKMQKSVILGKKNLKKNVKDKKYCKVIIVNILGNIEVLRIAYVI